MRCLMITTLTLLMFFAALFLYVRHAARNAR